MKELVQTISARRSVWWAGVGRVGRIVQVDPVAEASQLPRRFGPGEPSPHDRDASISHPCPRSPGTTSCGGRPWARPPSGSRRQELHGLVQRDVVGRHALRKRGVQLPVLHVRSVTTVQQLHRLPVLRVCAHCAEGLGPGAASSSLGLREELQGPLERDRVDVVGLLQGAEVSVVNHVRPVPSDPGPYRFIAFRMRTQVAGKRQKAECDVERNLVRAHALGQRSPLRFLAVLRLLAELHERPESTGPDVHGQAGLRVCSDRTLRTLAVGHEFGRLLDREVCRREVIPVW